MYCSTTKIESPHRAFYFCMYCDLWWELRVGAVLREQNALPTRLSIALYLTAKDAIDNGGAGRAAKSATLTTSTTKTKSPHRAFYFCMYYDLWWELRVGAVLREQNALPTRLSTSPYLTAKDTIDKSPFLFC